MGRTVRGTPSGYEGSTFATTGNGGLREGSGPAAGRHFRGAAGNSPMHDRRKNGGTSNAEEGD